jgi:hypothetical protein
MSAYIGVSITMAIISLGLLDHLKEAAGANFCLFEVAGMQLMIRTGDCARAYACVVALAAEDSGPTTFTAGSTTPIRCRFLLLVQQRRHRSRH